MSDSERYAAAAHAMQSGVAFKMNHDPKETEPKHLRVGINAAMSDQGGLVKILIDKGVFTLEEYTKAIADQMEIEAESYRLAAQQKTGHGGITFA
jgi:uncharacterized lipoprotein YbaY